VNIATITKDWKFVKAIRDRAVQYQKRDVKFGIASANVEKRGPDLVLCVSLEVLCSQQTRMRIGISISRRDKGIFLWNLFLV
jgi:hypothetical protein